MRKLRLVRGVTMSLAASLLSAVVPATAFAHLGDSDHIHQPPSQTTPTSAIWCMQFTDDPGTWLPDGANVVDGAAVEGRLIFVDCSDVLADDFAVDSFSGGRFVRDEYAGLVSQPDADTPVAEATDGPSSADYITTAAWTKHQRQWLQKGDKLASQLTKATTLSQIRKGLGTMQKHLTSESTWLRKNSDRFEPGSCVASDKANWEKRVAQARKNLNNMVTAVNRGNVAAVSSSGRQFTRAYTKIEQIYRAGVCEF